MKNNKKKNKKKRAPDPPGYLRPNSFVPRAPKGTHAGEGSLASEKVSLPTLPGGLPGPGGETEVRHLQCIITYNYAFLSNVLFFIPILL